MNILVKRFDFGKEYTMGMLYIDGKYICDTLEDTDRNLTSDMTESEILKVKQKHNTAIPYGTYKIDMNTVSSKYSNFAKYGWAKLILGKVPRLLDVKGYTGVLIHPGNTHQDTSGCILVGKTISKGSISRSQATFKSLYDLMIAAHKRGEEISLTIEKQV